MPRYDAEPETGFPLPPQIVDNVKARDEAEEKTIIIRALAQKLADPENVLLHKQEAERRRKQAGVQLLVKRHEYIPGLIDPGPMAYAPSSASAFNPATAGEASQLAQSPKWQNAVAEAVGLIGKDADLIKLRRLAMRLYQGQGI